MCWTGASVHLLSAATYYVNSSAGNDSYTTTQAQNPSTPWLTLDHAVPLLSPGNTLQCSGTFTGLNLTVSVSGTAQSPITIQGGNIVGHGGLGCDSCGNFTVNGNYLIFDGQDITGNGATLASGGCTMYYVNGNNCIFRNIVLHDMQATVTSSGDTMIQIVDAGNNNVYTNITFRNLYDGDLFRWYGNNTLATHCVFTNCLNNNYSASGNHADLIQTWYAWSGGQTESSNILEDSIIVNCNTSGGMLGDWDATGSTTYPSQMHDWVYRNNIFWNNASQAIQLAIPNFHFYNNVMYNWNVGFYFFNGDYGNTGQNNGDVFFNNVFVQDAMGFPYGNSGVTGMSINYSSFDSTTAGNLGKTTAFLGSKNYTNTVAACAFVNAAAGDFHLTANSVLIGKGTNLYNDPFASRTDMDGNARPTSAAWDIGPYQYAAAQSNPPSISSDLVGVTNNTAGGFTLSLGASGTSPLTYNWFFNATQVQSGSSSTYGSIPATTNQSGNYQVIVTNLYGAVTSRLVTVLITNAVTNFVPLSFSVTNAYGTLVSNAGGATFTITSNYLSQSTETSDPTQGNQALYWFNITNAGNYVILATVNCPNSGADSFFLNIDSQPTTKNIWDIYPPTTGWTNVYVSWRGANSKTNDQYSPVVFSNLKVGAHELVLVGREAGAEISWLVVTNYSGATQPPPSPAIQVVPTNLTLGTVLIGADPTSSFVVQNAGGGTLSGTASVGAPFSVVSGGSYSLSSNQSQTVTVAFNPASAGSYNQSVTLTGGGGASVNVSGSATNAPAPAAPIGLRIISSNP